MSAEETLDRSAIIEALRFYEDSGVDCILECSNPESSPKSPGKCVVVEEKSRDSYVIDWVENARSAAQACNTLQELQEAVKSFEGCPIKNSALNTVFSDGNPNAKIMLIGEAPGSNEDKHGIPFCGASGMLLDKMLAAIGLSRKNTYISNTIFWRPPGNRKPTHQELEACKPFVERHISLVSPQILVLVGSTACYALLDTQDSISRLRGKFYEYTNQFISSKIDTTVIFHPAYLLRQPMQKRLAWEDLKLIRAHIESKKIEI